VFLLQQQAVGRSRSCHENIGAGPAEFTLNLLDQIGLIENETRRGNLTFGPAQQFGMQAAADGENFLPEQVFEIGLQHEGLKVLWGLVVSDQRVDLVILRAAGGGDRHLVTYLLAHERASDR